MKSLIRTGSVLLLLIGGRLAAQPALAEAMDQVARPLYPADAPGAAIVVVRNGQVLFRKGYGIANLELGVPIRPEMVFRLCSVTKQFTAVAIMMLVERGKLALDDDITKFLPAYPTRGKRITVENLLTHTSGIRDYITILWPEQMRQDFRLERLIDSFKNQPLEFEPGTKDSYSNSNYILLGAIIEKLSGKPYRRFIEEEIFKPLGMKHSFYEGIQELIPNRVSGYLKDEGGYANAPYLSTNQLYAAGALCASVDDLALWDAAVDGGKLLAPQSWKRIFIPYRFQDGRTSPFALGWAIGTFQGKTLASHGGGIWGSRAFVLRIPEEHIYVAILANDSTAETQPEVVAKRLAAIAMGKPIADAPVVTLDPKALDGYTGTYRGSEDTLKVRRDGARLLAQAQEDPEFELFPTADDAFLVKAFDARIRFVRDAKGAVSALVMDFMGKETKLEKKAP